MFGNKELPIQMIRRMNTSLNVYNAFRSYQAGASRLGEWARANPGQSRLVNMVREMRQNV